MNEDQQKYYKKTSLGGPLEIEDSSNWEIFKYLYNFRKCRVGCDPSHSVVGCVAWTCLMFCLNFELLTEVTSVASALLPEVSAKTSLMTLWPDPNSCGIQHAQTNTNNKHSLTDPLHKVLYESKTQQATKIKSNALLGFSGWAECQGLKVSMHEDQRIKFKVKIKSMQIIDNLWFSLRTK